MALPHAVESQQPRGRHAAKIKDDQNKMPRGPRDPTVTLPPPRGGKDGKRRTEERALATHPADEIDVFHDGDLSKASYGLEARPPDE